jgi:hypothetical protein
VGVLLFPKLEIAELYPTVRDIVIVAVIVMSVGLLAFVYLNAGSKNPYRSDYAGKIVDKGLRTYESEEGSSIEHYLIIEEEEGTRSQVIVSASIYERAKVGMWIKNGKTGIKLSTSQNSSEAP